MKKPSLYLISVALLMFIMPIVSIAVASMVYGATISVLLIGRWFVFWSNGVRLFIAGIRQVSKPEFTAREIFHFTGTESYPVIRELGFANLCIGMIGMLSLHSVQWCQLAAICGGLYYGLAGILHVFKKRESTNEIIAMVTDLFQFAVCAAYLVFAFGIYS